MLERQLVARNAMNAEPTDRDSVASRWLILIALVPGLVIVTRGTYDLSQLHKLLPVPLWLFFLASLGLIAANLRYAFSTVRDEKPVNRWVHTALVLAIPIAFLGAALDCMGLRLDGCTPDCKFLTRVWSPLVGATAITYLVSRKSWFPPIITVLTFAYLVPNCRCYNPMNVWWLQHLHRSPACFGAGYWVSLTAVSALLWQRFQLASAAVCWIINLALLAFFVGHHYFRVPW
jgi:hypothetical protein